MSPLGAPHSSISYSTTSPAKRTATDLRSTLPSFEPRYPSERASMRRWRNASCQLVHKTLRNCKQAFLKG